MLHQHQNKGKKKERRKTSELLQSSGTAVDAISRRAKPAQDEAAAASGPCPSIHLEREEGRGGRRGRDTSTPFPRRRLRSICVQGNTLMAPLRVLSMASSSAVSRLSIRHGVHGPACGRRDTDGRWDGEITTYYPHATQVHTPYAQICGYLQWRINPDTEPRLRLAQGGGSPERLLSTMRCGFQRFHAPPPASPHPHHAVFSRPIIPTAFLPPTYFLHAVVALPTQPYCLPASGQKRLISSSGSTLPVHHSTSSVLPSFPSSLPPSPRRPPAIPCALRPLLPAAHRRRASIASLIHGYTVAQRRRPASTRRWYVRQFLPRPFRPSVFFTPPSFSSMRQKPPPSALSSSSPSSRCFPETSLPVFAHQ